MTQAAQAVQRADTPWYLGQRFRSTALVVLSAFVAGEAVVGILLKDNDFEWHRGLGQAFLQGAPYDNGGYHYLPARPMLNAATAWLPYRVDRALVYALAIAALAWTVLAWTRLAASASPLPPPSGSPLPPPSGAESLAESGSAGGEGSGVRGDGNQRQAKQPAIAFAGAFFALAISVTYLQRDLDECGLQILLLFFLTAAVVALQAGQALRCGFWLALAVVYKLTPLLFLPYLCYKRQWSAAAAMLVCIAGLCLTPALYLGWDANLRAHDQWWTYTHACLTTPNPTENSIQPPTHRNQALALSVTRFLQTYPTNHPLYLEHPLFAQFGDLGPASAKRIVQGSLLILALLLAWRMRRRLTNADAGALPREWAAVAILTAILSPFCWLQHLALVLPAVLLGTHAALDGALSRPQRMLAALIALVMIVAGQRDLLGHGLFMVLMSYKLPAWSALGAALLVLSLRKQSVSAEGDVRLCADSDTSRLAA